MLGMVAFAAVKRQMIPLAATRGQVTWSVDGADDLVLIGRAEQADLSLVRRSSARSARAA